MADANARINIDINTSAAAAGLRQLQSQITAFNSTLTKSSAVQATAMRNSTSNMLELVNASRFFTAETVRMQTAAASLDTTLKKGQGTLGTFLGAKFRKNSLAAAQVMSLAETRAQALQTQFVATGAAANGMRDAIAIRPLQAFNNAAVVSAQKLAIHRAMLNQATTSMINFGKNTQWTGRQLMVGFTVPLTIFGGVAGKVFRDLEKEAVNFKKVYGDSFTPPEEMEANLNAVKELAKEYTKYGIAVKDTVGLAAEAAAAGAQNAELIDATTQATRLATLGQMEQNEALKTTISLQNAFKLSGDELANSINFLNMVENQTVVTLQDLSGAIPRVAPVIKGLGGDVRDLATFLAAMQEGGVSAAQGSMALKSGLASLINPTEKAKERLAEMGISIDTIIQANKGDLMGTVQALAAALDTLDQFGRQQAIEELFGKFQYARLAALFDNINKEGTQAARVMEISAMSAAEMAASAEKELGAIEEAVGTKFVAAMEQLKLAIAPIGEIFTKMAIPVINLLAKIADAFNKLPDGTKTFIGIATAIVGLVIPAGTMFLGLLVNLVGTLIKFGSTVGTAFRGFLSGGIKGAFDAVSQSTKYMSLAEIDAANSAQQLAGSTEAVNKALLGQVGSSESAQAAVMELAYAYEILTQQMREAAAQNKLVFGVGAAAMGNVPGRGPIRRNRGGTVPGSGNTDTVPAMLTPGEFVVNKQATRENLPLLKEINNGEIPGVQYLMRGGAVLSRAAQLKAIRKGEPFPESIQDVSLRSIFKHTFNDVKASTPSSFVKGMFSRWEAVPTRVSPKENTSMLLKGKKPRYPAVPQEEYLADMIMSGDKYSDTIDAFKPVSVGPMFNNPNDTRVFDGHTRIHAQVVKGLIKRNLGKDTASMSKQEIVDAIRIIQKKSLADEITDADVIRATYGQRILTKEPYSRDVERLFERPGKRQSMESMYNRAGRTLIPGIHDREIEEIVNAARSANFYGVKKDPESLMQAMGFVSLGGGERYRYEPGRDFRNRSSYVNNMGRRIIDNLIDSKAILPLRRNKGGSIPGSGNTDTVPAMLTPGEFVVNKQATQDNLGLLKYINQGGNVPGFNIGGLLAATGAAVRSRSLLSGAQVAGALGVSERTLRRISASAGLPKAGGKYLYTPETIPTLAAQTNVRMQKTHTTPFRSMTTMPSTIPGSSQRAQLSKLMAGAGIPIQVVDDAWLLLPSGVNQKLRAGGVKGSQLLEAIEDFSRQPGFFGPAYRNVDRERFISNLRSSIRPDAMYTDYGQGGGLNAGALFWSAARKSAPQGGFIPTQVGGYTANTQTFRNSVGTLNKRYAGQYSFHLDETGKKPIMRVFDSKGNRVLTEDIQASAGWGFNRGSLVPGQGNEDTVPAMLTPGEFVVNKKATQSNLALLKAINDGQIKGYELGGIVEALPGQYLVEGRNGRTFGPMSYSKAIQRSKQLVSARARRGMVARRGGGAAGMMAGRGMGMSMGMGMIGSTAMMGGMMLPGVAENPALSGAVSAGGMGLSMLSMLPMLGVGGPVTLAIAGVAAAATAAGVALYKWRDGVDTASRKAAEFGANLGGTANALNNISSIMGQQTPSQRKAQLQLSEKDVETLNENAQQFQAIFSSEEGQAFIKDLTDATSAERFQKLSDYLKYAIASGLMDTQVAQSFAKGISSEIGDAVLGTQVSTALRGQRAGAAGLVDLAEKRISNSTIATSKALEETVLSHTDASKAIGSATQIIQDFANAEALAREQFASGEITYKQMQEIINQATEAQSRYNDVIEAAIDKTDDLGGTMQATIQQMVNAGTITEEGFKELEKIAYSQQGPALTPQQVSESENVLADLMDAEAAVINETAIAIQKFDPEELMAAQISAIQSGISLANVKSIGEEIASGRGPVFDIYSEQVGLGKSGFAAFETAMSAQAISSLVGQTQRRGPGGAVSAREVARDIAIRFDASGGDTEALQRIIASLPESGTKRIDFLVNFDLMTPQQQQKFLSDSQELSSMFGEEFANTLQASDEYKTALEKGSTQIFKDNMAEAKTIFGDSTQNIYDYANKVKVPLTELTEKGQAIANLPDELAFKLGVEVTNIEDLEKFGPMADELGEAWPILQKLPESFNLKAFVEANTSKNGELASPKELADEMILMKNSLADLDSTKPEVVKKAVVDILVSHGGTEADAQSAFSDILGNMEEFNDFQLEDKMAVVGIMVKYMEDVAALSEATKTAMNLQGGGAMRGLSILQEAVNESAEAAEIAMQSARINMNMPGTSRGGSSGGGTPEKTLAEQLEEQRKLVESFADRFGSKRGVKLLAKPFGPEFLQYLKSQGQKGLDMLKGNFKKMRSAYKDFAATQKAESLVVLQFMPGKLTEELEARKNSLQLVKQIAKEEGMSLQTATQAVDVLDATQQADYISLISKKKLSKEDKNRLNIYKEILSLSKQAALFDEQNAEVMQFMNMSAEERESARISNLQDIQNINKQIEEIKVLEPLQKQLDAQQKIIDASQRAIELKQRESDEISRAIELKERELEPLDEQIEKLEEQQEKVQEVYDDQIEALDKIFEQESEIIALREKSLDVADALSTGDIAAAARAQMELQSELAAQRREDQRSLLEAQNEAEIAAIDEQINDIKEQRVAIEEEVERLQLKQRNIQDEIYKLNQKQIPVQDEIYRLQQRIASETDRLNSKYDDTRLRLQSLNAQLVAALETQNAINQAAAEENKIRAQKAQQAAAVAPPPSVAQAPIVTGEPPSTPFTGWSEEFAADPIMIYSPDQIIANIEAMSMGYYGMGGKVKKYAMGGMVNYKGSREPAPGFAMGGRVKKYAYGSIVPGIGATDKVPAMLTPGEFVVRKSVAQTYGPLLSAINGNVFPKMGGSSAMPRGSAKGSGSMYNYNVNVTLNGSDMNPDDVANAVMRKIKMTENTRVRGYNTRG